MIWIKVLFLLSGFISLTLQSNSSVFQSFMFQLKTCFNSRELVNCLKNETIYILDSVLKDTNEWRINDMISIKSNNSEDSYQKDLKDIKKSFKNSLSDRIKRLFKSRHIEIKLLNNVEEGE